MDEVKDPAEELMREMDLLASEREEDLALTKV